MCPVFKGQHALPNIPEEGRPYVETTSVRRSFSVCYLVSTPNPFSDCHLIRCRSFFFLTKIRRDGVCYVKVGAVTVTSLLRSVLAFLLTDLGEVRNKRSEHHFIECL